ARGIVVREDRQRADKRALRERWLVCLAITEQQEIESRGVQFRIKTRPVVGVGGGICLAPVFGVEQQRPQDPLELRVIRDQPSWGRASHRLRQRRGNRRLGLYR